MSLLKKTFVKLVRSKKKRKASVSKKKKKGRPIKETIDARENIKGLEDMMEKLDGPYGDDENFYYEGEYVEDEVEEEPFGEVYEPDDDDDDDDAPREMKFASSGISEPEGDELNIYDIMGADTDDKKRNGDILGTDIGVQLDVDEIIRKMTKMEALVGSIRNEHKKVKKDIEMLKDDIKKLLSVYEITLSEMNPFIGMKDKSGPLTGGRAAGTEEEIESLLGEKKKRKELDDEEIKRFIAEVEKSGDAEGVSKDGKGGSLLEYLQSLPTKGSGGVDEPDAATSIDELSLSEFLGSLQEEEEEEGRGSHVDSRVTIEAKKREEELWNTRT